MSIAVPLGKLSKLCQANAGEYKVAILAGSSTVFPLDLVDDFDILLLDAHAEVPKEKEQLGRIGHRSVEAIRYPDTIAQAISRNDVLVFYAFRELMKIAAGEYIDGSENVLKRSRDDVFNANFPKERLLALLNTNRDCCTSPSNNSVAFLRSFDLVRLACGFTYSAVGPVKPKWTSYAASAGYPEEFMAVVEQLTELLSPIFTPAGILAELGRAPKVPVRNGILQNVKDANYLSVRYQKSAIFPFIAALLQMIGERETEEIRKYACSLIFNLNDALLPALPLLDMELSNLEHRLCADVEHLEKIGDVAIKHSRKR